MQYRPHLDGLRALAILPVIFYHAGVGPLSGGFVGVDIFFVLSGYLITGILLTEIEARRFSLLSFYERRARRILPALFAIILFATFAGYYLLLPHDLKQFGQSAVATTFFSSNIFFWRGSGYFDMASELKPLLHTWSLAVEEQFYIVYPVFLAGIYRLRAGLRAPIVLLVAMLSLALSVWAASHAPIAGFYLAPPRAFELLIGALVAMRLVPPPRSRLVNEGLAVLGLLAVAGAVMGFDRHLAFPGALALIPCLGTALLIRCGEGRGSVVARVLEIAPLVLVGKLSYSLYLWHWPLLAFARYWSFGELSTSVLSFIVILAAVPAYLSYRFIEQPIRTKHWLKSPKSVFRAACASAAALAALGGVFLLSDGLPQRLDGARRALLLANERAIDDWAYPLSCQRNFQAEFRHGEEVAYCPIGSGTGMKALFWGDSHVEQLYPALVSLLGAQEPAGQALMATAGGCLPIVGIERNVPGADCRDFNEAVLERAAASDIDTVVVGGFWSDFYPDQDLRSATYNFCIVDGECRQFRDPHEILSFMTTALIRQLSELKAEGKRIVIILPFPTFKYDVPRYMSRRIWHGAAPEPLLSRSEHMVLRGGFYGALEEVAARVGARLLDPAEFLCGSGECVYREGMVSDYKDAGHLSSKGALRLIPMLKPIW